MLIQYIKKHILASTFGVLGFVSALVTMFVNTSDTMSIKWLIFAIFIALSVIVLLIGFIIEIQGNSALYETNIKQLKLQHIKRTDNGLNIYKNLSNVDFDYGDVVKVYMLDGDNIEVYIGVGVIVHVQPKEKICHIEFITKDSVDSDSKEVYFSLKINKDQLEQLSHEENISGS